MVEMIVFGFALSFVALLIFFIGPRMERFEQKKRLESLSSALPGEQIELECVPHKYLRLMDAFKPTIRRGEQRVEAYFSSGSAGVPSLLHFYVPLSHSATLIVNTRKVSRLTGVVYKYKQQLSTADPDLDQKLLISSDDQSTLTQSLLQGELKPLIQKLIQDPYFYELRLTPANYPGRPYAAQSQFIQARPGVLIATRHKRDRLLEEADSLQIPLDTIFLLVPLVAKVFAGNQEQR